MEKKEELQKQLVKVGVPATVAEFLADENRQGKVIASEGLEVGDEITIVGFDDKIGEFNGNKFLRVITTGSRSSISLSRLIGAQKKSKWHGAEIAARCLVLPHNEKEAVLAVQSLVGKTLRVIDIQEDCLPSGWENSVDFAAFEVMG